MLIRLLNQKIPPDCTLETLHHAHCLTGKVVKLTSPSGQLPLEFEIVGGTEEDLGILIGNMWRVQELEVPATTS